MQTIIQLQNVTKKYGSVTALDQVSLAVPAGTVCALLGDNGAGKTTAIRLMMGYEAPDAGICSVQGMIPSQNPMEVRRQVGYVPDRPALYDWMKVDEIGWFASGFYPPGFADEYQRCLKKFGLQGSQKIRHLSKGGRAKVALALALAAKPSLMILDEPTSGLDPLVRREFLESMIDLTTEGRTVFLSSHQVSEVERVADVVAILIKGRMVCVERLDDLKQSVLEVGVPQSNAHLLQTPQVGQLMAEYTRGEMLMRLVRDLDVDRLREECRARLIPDPIIRRPGLEDILLAMLRDERSGRSAAPAPRMKLDDWTTPAVAAETFR